MRVLSSTSIFVLWQFVVPNVLKLRWNWPINNFKSYRCKYLVSPLSTTANFCVNFESSQTRAKQINPAGFLGQIMINDFFGKIYAVFRQVSACLNFQCKTRVFVYGLLSIFATLFRLSGKSNQTYLNPIKLTIKALIIG